MDTEKSSLIRQNLPQFFKTLKPQPNSIPPKFNANYAEKSVINSPNQFRKVMGDQNLRQISELATLRVTDHSKSPLFRKTVIQGSSPILGECSSSNFSGGVNDYKSTQKKIDGKNDVIELKDDDFDDISDDDDDDDCVFVGKEKDFTPSGKNKNDPICVDEYVDEIKVTKFEKKESIVVDNVVHCVDYYDVDDNDEVRIVDVIPSSKKKRGFRSGVSVVELGESSGTKNTINDGIVIDIDDSVEDELTFLCDICADTKPRYEWFTIKGCSHSYCSDCMKNYVASKLQDGVSRVSCPVPDCAGVLEPEYCREILPSEVFERWGNLLCESVLLASQKFYCPFKDCSALLLDDGDESVTQCECPSCFRLFCAQCKVGWHAGFKCSEFQNLSKDEREKEDLMLRDLAKNKNWQRCPACKFYVEKSEGCLYMKCRCGIAFCYSCGAVNQDHRFHYCKKCGR
ncbi:hypothetical protein RND81_07G077900 [Saponaria officinalis]|uniref:RBR-type E3 ubiquitin transferase n=1 Tax=Saponaria officinalis TaxID=3572 RepID=A0AAW1JN08_SAPOF